MEPEKYWYRPSYSQSRNIDTGVENKCMDTKEGRGWDELELMYIHYYA